MANNRELSQFANTIGYNGGNIGIGTDNPLNGLDVNQSEGRLRVNRFSHLLMQNKNDSTTDYWAISARNGGELDIGYGTPDGNSLIGGDKLTITSDGKVRVPDDGKFVAGDGDDLQIYHDGTHSYIKNATGNLYFQHGGENMAQFSSDGNVELYYDNSKKFETVSTGVKITTNLYLGGSLNGGFSYNSTANTLEFLMTNGGTHSELTSNSYVPSATATRHLGYHNKRWDKLFCDGVRFGGDNTDATTLDDYEEGTWTPALQNAGSPTIGTSTGIYTKIGNFVHCTFYISFAGATLTSSSRISGLPFAYNSTEPNIFLSRVGQCYDSSASNGFRTCSSIGHTSSGTTWIYVDLLTSGSSKYPRGEFVMRIA